MNRRDLLQAMLTVPVISALGGCRRQHNDHHPFPPSRGGTLKVILQGPFAVVVDTKNHNRIKAFVPFDKDGKHEFCFGNPHDGPVSGEGDRGERKRYDFTLLEHNLEISEQPRHIDAGFDAFKLHTGGKWEPSPNEYFVTVDLPAPDIITFIPPPVPVLFVGSKLAMMPTNHVLEYKVREFDEVQTVSVHSPQLGDKPPLSCSDLLGDFEGYWHGMEKAHQDSRQRTYMEAELNGCANSQVRAFFFGVGLPSGPSFEADAATHAREFFNNRLLASFPNAPEVENKKLLEVDVKPCPAAGNDRNAPKLIPAAQRYPMPQPRLVPVSYADDCRAGGIIGIRP
jgi:hypothetical protein